MSNKLSKTEAKQLEDLEAVIEVGVASFIEVGRALATINEQALYRLTHTTFAEYVADRWGMIKSQAYRYITASEVVDRLKCKDGQEVSPIGDKLPTNESQVRELAKLPPEEQADAWEEVVQTTATPTAQVVKAVVEKRQEAIQETKQPVPKRPRSAEAKEAEQAIVNAEPGRELLALVRTCMSRLKKLPDLPGLELVNGRRQSIQSHLENAANAISVYLPAEVCPKCHGKKCAHCGNFGWVNRIMQQQLKK